MATASKNGMIFERHEKKFLVTPEQLPALTDALKTYMELDPYGLHTINTIYYDTEDYALIRHSLDKPGFKQKLRLRSYGVPGETDKVYLELKKKLDGITYKRRMSLPLKAARNYLHRGIEPVVADAQTFGEIDWFIRTHDLSEKVLLSYDRLALFGKEDAELRITFDANIRWRDYQLDLSKGDHGSYLLQPGYRMMEVKTMQALPLWLCELLSSLEIYAQSFSKYGRVYTAQLMPGRKEVERIAG